MVQLFMGLLAGAILYFAKAYMGGLIAFLWLIVYIVILLKARFKVHLTAVILGFTLLSFINGHLYFYSNEPGNVIEARIEAERASYYLGNHNGKTIKLFMDGSPSESNSTIEVGRKYLLIGEFKIKPDYPRGIVGEYYGNQYKPLRKDLIYKGYKIKEELYRKISETLGEDAGGIILALSCGDSGYIDYDKREEFNFLGISHIISVSGLHVALIYNILRKFTGKYISIILLLLFVIFTGGQASTVRAFIMIITMVISVSVRQRYEPISALAFSAFIILLMKPYSFLDVGCVLSFLAVLGILLFNKKFSRKLYKLPAAINSSLSLTLSSMILTLPYMIFIFEKISIGGFISNLFLIPFYTYLLVTGMGLLIFFKIPLVFNFLMYIATAVITIINGIEMVLLNKLPLPMEFTYLHGVIILFLYLSYVLIKRGVNSLKLFPILLMVLVIKESFIVYPEINFIAGKKADVIQVIHGTKDILISTEKVKLRSIYENCHKVDRIYDEFDQELVLDLNKNYRIKAIKVHGGMELIVIHKKQVTKFVSKDISSEYIDSTIGVFSYGNYDIIEVEKNEDTVNGRYYGTYKIIGGRSYPYYVH